MSLHIYVEFDAESKEWVASADRNDSPEYDGSGPSIEAALFELATAMFKALNEGQDE